MKDKIYNFFNRGDVAFPLVIIMTVAFFKWAFWIARVLGK